ncbi:D-sedoheptulose-7-phosphate isomerase [Paenibacillus roseipurpureus]|uniref:SIS domain-containing protein n=1 Tax=Paenibacillus roseopurpureus TaxID=2918901 RepID=A0AA96LKJ8_9BACL|nr:SIS domain-containing protein [Paenibacillus sp. MBLB1832]WNR43470.1 SIS domain-containing protein [Paenibacillus sp. MBLB1832]
MLQDSMIERWMSGLISKYPDLSSCKKDIEAAYRELSSSFHSGGKLMVCGNGGSAADSEHIVGELMKGFMSKRPLGAKQRSLLEGANPTDGAYLADRLQGALPAISLVSHSALITAYANDVAPDMIFGQQVYGLGREGDVLLALSTSGNSANVVRAVQVANAIGVRTIGLTGKGGGKLGELCTVTIRVPYNLTPDIQERHLPIYHTLCMMVEQEFFEA